MSKHLDTKLTQAISRQQATIYHMLRTSLSNFSKAPAELGEKEIQYVRIEAEKQYELEEMVLGSQEAKNVVIPEALLTRSVNDIRQRYDSDDEYQKDLQKNHLTEESLRTSLYRELKVEAVLDKISAKVADVSDIDIRLYYFMHKDKFTQPESRVVRHILITINEDFPENTRIKSLERIIDIQKRLRVKPKRFSEQAKKHSECPTAMNGGLIGNIPRGQLFPELDAVLFGMQEGQLSEIVETEMGFHLLLCETIYPDGPIEYRRAAQIIKEKLLEKRRRICQRTWLKQIAKNTNENVGAAHAGK